MRKTIVFAAAVLASAVALVLMWSRTDDRIEPSSGHEAATPQEAAATRRVPSPVPGTDTPEEVSAHAVPSGAVDRDHDLHGVVVDGQGVPLAGCEVAVVSYPWRRLEVPNYSLYRAELAGPRTETRIDGTFRLPLARGDFVGLRVSLAGYAPVELTSLQAGEAVRVVLAEGVRLKVAVRDEAGAPVTGVQLRLTRSRGVRDVTFDYERFTPSSGECLFTDLPGGLVAWLDVQHETSRTGFQRVTLPTAGEGLHEAVLARGRTLAGRVTEAGTGRPIVGARVGMSWKMTGASATDDTGRYELTGWTGRGLRTLHAKAEGYGPAKKVVGKTETIDFELERGDAVVGRVIGADDVGVEGALVSAIAAVRRDGEKVTSTCSVISWGDGRFRLSDLRNDLPHTLVVLAKGHGRVLLDFDPATEPGGVVDLGDVKLPPARRIEGRAVTAAGETAARVPVSLRGANDDRPRLRGDVPALRPDYDLRDRRLTDDLGRFRFADLAPGTYEATLRLDGARPATKKVVLSPSSDVLDLVLRPEGDRSLRVRVVDEDDRPVAGMTVIVNPERGETLGESTGSDGTCRFTIPGDVASVRVGSHSGAPRRHFLPAPEVRPLPDQVEVRFVLREAGHVAGRVVGPQGRSLAGMTIRVGDEGRFGADSDSDGRFRVKVALAGPSDLAVFGRVSKSAPHHAGQIVAGELRGVVAGEEDLVLHTRIVDADQTLTAAVTSPAGDAVPGVDVGVTGLGGDLHRFGRTDEQGEIVFEKLPAAELVVSVGGGGKGASSRGEDGETLLPEWATPEKRRIVPSGQRVVLSYRASVALAGLLTEPDGKPVAMGYVQAFKENRRVATAFSDRDGRFTLRIPVDVTGALELRAVQYQNMIPLAGTARNAWPGTSDLQIKMQRP